MSEFTDRLTEEMDYQGLRKADIASACGVPDATVRNWWNRDSMPAADTAVKLAKLLHVTVEYLITGNNSQPLNNFSTDEKNLIQDFRCLTETEKQAVLSVIQSFKKTTSSQIKIS